MVASTIGGAPNRVLVVQDDTGHCNAKVFRARAAPQGMCDNLINVFKLLANEQKDGDSVRMIVPGLPKKSRRKSVDGPRLFVTVGNYAAVKIGDLERETRSKKGVKPKFTTHIFGAVIREGADTLNLRAHEEGVLHTFIDTTKVGNKGGGHRQLTRTGTPSARQFFQGVEGPEWEAMNDQYKDLHQAVKSKKSGETKKAKVLWVLFDLLAVLLPTVAEFCRFFPSRMGCRSMERVVMRSLYRCRNVANN